MQTKINWGAVLVSVVACMLVGFLWYGVIFSHAWMDGNDLRMDMENHKVFQHGVEIPMSNTPMILNVISMFAYALILNWIIAGMGISTWMGGMKLGAAIGVIVALAVSLGHLFAFRPNGLIHIDGSYTLVMFTVMGTILGGWRKR